MTILKIGKKDYKIKFGYNCFCDTDLMDKVQEMAKTFSQKGSPENDSDVAAMGKIKDLFCIVRELIFVGFKKYNPVLNVQEVGDLLDQYKDEAKDGEERGLIQLFNLLSDELMKEGFLSDLILTSEKQEKQQNLETK